MIELVVETKRNYLLAVLELFKQKIEESVIEENVIILSIESPVMTLLETFHIVQYEITDKLIYLDSNLTLNIILDEIEIFTYYNGEYEDDAYFQIIYKEMDIKLYFL